MRSSTTKVVHRALHGFSDASSKTYGGVVYLRVILDDTMVLTFLVAAKSRVAPIKTQTIPRLDFCGAFLLTNLLYQVSLDLNIPLDSIYVWTVYSVVLGWLRSPINRLKVFVAHRVVRITEKVPARRCRHVDTSSNPAVIVC